MLTSRWRLLAWCLLLPSAVWAQSIPRWNLSLSHAVRPAEGSPDALGAVTGIAVLTDGSVYVAEDHPARVALYGPDGHLSRVIMREGNGPGETRSPKIANQGDTLVVFDPPQSRLTRMARNGRLIDERSVGASPQAHVWAVDDGTVILDLARPPDGWDGSAVRVGSGGRVDTIRWIHPRAEDLSIQWNGPGWDLRGRSPFSPRGVATFDPGGRLVIGGSRRSQWVVVSGKDTLKTVSLPDRVQPIEKRVRDSVWNVWYAQLIPKKLPQLDDVVREDRIPINLPPWVTFHIDRSGAWWVGRPGQTGLLGSWDIVVGDRAVGHASIPEAVVDVFPVGPIVSFGSNYVALLHEDRESRPWIGVYRVNKGSR